MPTGLSKAFAILALVTCLPAYSATGAATGKAESPSAVLSRMTAAMRDLDYQGSFVYQHDDQIDALRIFHAGGTPERERLISLTGPRNEVVRDGTTVTCIQSGAQPTVFTNSTSSLPIPSFATANPGSIAAHYTLTLDGQERVAGYLAQRIEVAPNDAFRYGYRLWIERDSHVLLRSVVLDKDDRHLEQFMFVALQIGAAPSAGDLLPRKTSNAAPSSDEVALDGPPQWRVAQLPAGFKLVSGRRPARASNGAEHLVYSDGLASVSLYVEPLGNAPAGKSANFSRGSLNVRSEDHGEWRITALGNVPAATVEQFVKSTRQINRAR